MRVYITPEGMRVMDEIISPEIDFQHDPILTPIIDAFTKIERADLKVNRIVIEEDKYWNLLSKKKYLTSVVDFIPGKPHNFQLWGAKVEKGLNNKENRAYSERSYFTSYDVEIKFNPILFKKYHIIVKSRANIIINAPKSELRAIDTLREMITEADYRKYMTHSFITVPVPSGKTYQIFRNDNHVKIWSNGTLIEELCVYIRDGKIPPTDKVITLKTMIETDEEGTRKLGNIYRMYQAA